MLQNRKRLSACCVYKTIRGCESIRRALKCKKLTRISNENISPERLKQSEKLEPMDDIEDPSETSAIMDEDDTDAEGAILAIERRIEKACEGGVSNSDVSGGGKNGNTKRKRTLHVPLFPAGKILHMIDLAAANRAEGLANEQPLLKEAVPEGGS